VARNIAAVKGVKELAAKVNALRTTMAGEKAMRVMGSAAFIGRDAVARAILSANWPKETKQQVREQFTPFVNAKTGRRDNIVALFGIRKRGRAKPYVAGYTEWGKRGPKTHYRRTAEVVRQVIRHRFLDADASPEVIAQKLCQSGWEISIRSVQRVIEEYGLQKKTLSVSTDH